MVLRLRRIFDGHLALGGCESHLGVFLFEFLSIGIGVYPLLGVAAGYTEIAGDDERTQSKGGHEDGLTVISHSVAGNQDDVGRFTFRAGA